MLTIAALMLLAGAPPAGFTVVRDAVKIDKVVWYDAQGEKHVTDEPYLQLRFKVTNNAKHALRWPGFSQARVTWGTRYVGGNLLPVSFGAGSRIDGSLLPDQKLWAGQASTILVVYKVPPQRAEASVRLKWKGESPGVVITINNVFDIPVDK